jgi:hypothetical protein
MSIIVAYRTDDAVLVASDGIATDDDGVVLGITSKIDYLPEFNAVIGGVGIGSLSTLALFHLRAKYRDFDELLQGIGHDLALATQHLVLLHEAALPFGSNGTLFVAGWSDARQRFEMYRIGNWEKEKVLPDGSTETMPAFSLQPIGAHWASARPTQEAARAHGVDAPTSEGTNLNDRAVSFVRACRASGSIKDADGHALHVGGFIQVTILERDRCHTEIVHRWPDEIGKPITADEV